MSTVLDGSTVGIQPPLYRLPSAAHLGRVRLAVSDLERSIAFYTEVIGLSVLTRAENFAELGIAIDGRLLLELEEGDGVQPITGGTRLGLYHTAFLLPSRAALSSFVDHLNRLGVPFGAGDHSVSEAVYLIDPDGLSVEVYADRSRAQWVVRDGQIVTGTKPLDFVGLLATPHERWLGAPTGTTMGHIHLYIGNLDEAARFYQRALGMDIMTGNFPGALFVAAGGYHHHVGLNTWAAGSPKASRTDARVLFWELLLPDTQELKRVAASMSAAGWHASTAATDGIYISDPWGINVLLAVG